MPDSKISDLPLLGLTMGDPAGIGPEIIVKALTGAQGRAMRARTRVLVVGSASILTQTIANLGLTAAIEVIQNPSNVTSTGDTIQILDPLSSPLPTVVPGVASAANGHAAVAFIRKAVRLAMDGRIDAIVTAPINKAAMALAGYPYPGHTELLGELTEADARRLDYGMMLVGGPLRIMFATTHMALNDVSAHIRISTVSKAIRLAHAAATQLFGISSPRISVAGLNPHAGEGGRFGDEEQRVIIPAVEQTQSAGIDASGPFPADTLFHRAANGAFDIVVAMYHDQGLIPLKLLAFGRSVNITVGLPIVRTSVDHGTAYDIVGMGVADTGSLIEAIHVALRILEHHPTHEPSSTNGR